LNNKNFKCEKFLPNQDNIKYGLSPLDCWIRFLEFIVKASYKIVLKKWRIANDEDKKIMGERKKMIQQLFWENPRFSRR